MWCRNGLEQSIKKKTSKSKVQNLKGGDNR